GVVWSRVLRADRGGYVRGCGAPTECARRSNPCKSIRTLARPSLTTSAGRTSARNNLEVQGDVPAERSRNSHIARAKSFHRCTQRVQDPVRATRRTRESPDECASRPFPYRSSTGQLDDKQEAPPPLRHAFDDVLAHVIPASQAQSRGKACDSVRHRVIVTPRQEPSP